jgi:hypothetical protein
MLLRLLLGALLVIPAAAGKPNLLLIVADGAPSPLPGHDALLGGRGAVLTNCPLRRFWAQ